MLHIPLLLLHKLYLYLLPSLSLSLSLSLFLCVCVNLSSCHPPSTQIRPILLPTEGSCGSYTCIITFFIYLKYYTFSSNIVNFFTMQLYQYVTCSSLSLSKFLGVSGVWINDTLFSYIYG